MGQVCSTLRAPAVEDAHRWAEAHLSVCPAVVLVTTSWLTRRSPWWQCKMGSAHTTSPSPAMVSMCCGGAETLDSKRGCWMVPSHSPPLPCASCPPEENPAWLPLYGSVCCRLVAQPLCMTQPTANGTLRVQQAGELQDWARVHGVLKGTSLFCYRQPEDADTGEEPLFTIAINKVMGPLAVKLPGARAQERLLRVPGGWVQRDGSLASCS